MSDKPRSTRTGSHWKRPPTKVYDYNYDVGSNYYKGMINHLDKKSAGVTSEPPGPKSFAERIAEDSLYGRSKPVSYVSSDYASKSSSAHSSEFTHRSSLADYLAEEDSLIRSRRAPTVSDQIMDFAGVKSENMLDVALADLKKRGRAAHFADSEDNSMFSKTSMEDSMTKRRNMLRELDDELATIEGGLEKNRSSRKAALAALDQADACSSSLAQLSSSSTSSVNVKQRSMKTTVTSETVRY